MSFTSFNSVLLVLILD
ncbi:hypothetical protein FWK35_00011166 [Aphis craccivora]|nr:hypothetical protein FWK35_00016100 [Aphis craccivora]KAF0762574.1 hypothetical protein FWK35_00021160 [Aphis craccivora]KAF0762673.1 hypothetical protein FWK35_00011166 [Aphis craccivora]